MRRERLAPLVPQAVELTRLVDAPEGAGVPLDEIEVSFEHEAPPAGRNHPNLVAGSETCLS
jgi:hypothetical protein